MRAEVLNYLKKCHKEFIPLPAGLVVNFGAGWEDDSIRKFYESKNYKYISQDIEHYDNKIDVVCDLYDLGTDFPYKDISVALLLETIEHLERPWEVIEDIYALLVDSGWLIVTAPIIWEEHKYPLDCWRIMPDGMRYLLRSFVILDLTIEGKNANTVGKPYGWQGIFALGKKI